MLAIIPARGGSKGLPGKNIRSLCGKPLIAYTIEAAINSKYISKVIVSTDDIAIARVAKEYGADIPFIRPKELAQDNSLAIDNYIYTINKLNKKSGYSFDEFVVLQPTSPLRNAEDVDSAIELYKEREADSVISYTEEYHPILWHKFINDDHSLINIFNDNLKNRQEFRRSFFPNGAIYIFKFDLIKSKNYYSDNTYAYVMSRKNSIDIDSIDDFEYAEFLMSKRTQ